MSEPVEQEQQVMHLCTQLDTQVIPHVRGFPQRVLLEKRLDSARGCGCPVPIHQDQGREIPRVPTDSHSMSSGAKTKAALWHHSWMFCWPLFGYLYGKKIEHVSFEKGLRPANLVDSSTSWNVC